MKTVRTVPAALTLTGAMIGAGFISGAELVRFFVQYGPYAYWLVSAVIIILIILFSALMNIAATAGNVSNWHEFNQYLFGPRWANRVQPFIRLQWIVVSVTALSAGGSLIQLWLPELPVWSGSLLLLIITYSIVKHGFRIVIASSSWITLAAVFYFSISILYLLHQVIEGNLTHTGWIPECISSDACSTGKISLWISPLLYAGLNTAFCAGLLIPIAQTMKKPHHLFRVAWLTSAIFACLLVLGIAALAQLPANELTTATLPLLRTFQMHQTASFSGFSFLMLAEILTTLTAGLYSLISDKYHSPGTGDKNTQDLSVNRKRSSISILQITVIYIAAQLPLQQLINILYPISGAISLLWIAACLFRGSQIKRHRKDGT